MSQLYVHAGLFSCQISIVGQIVKYLVNNSKYGTSRHPESKLLTQAKTYFIVYCRTDKIVPKKIKLILTIK